MRGALGGVLEAGGVAPGALLERLLEEPSHRVPLLVGRRPVLEPHDGEPQLPVRDEARDVHRRPRRFEPLEVAGRVAPREREGGRVPVDRALRELRVSDREAPVPAVANDLGRDALVERADRPRVDEERVVGVAVDVDEARGDVEPGGVELHGRGGRLADRDDAVAGDPDVGDEGRAAGPVDDAAVADRDVERHARSRSAAVAASSTRHGGPTTDDPVELARAPRRRPSRRARPRARPKDRGQAASRRRRRPRSGVGSGRRERGSAPPSALAERRARLRRRRACSATERRRSRRPARREDGSDGRSGPSASPAPS